MLVAEERRQLLADWNDTGAKFEREKCIQELFEEQAGRTPGALAVVFGEEQLTYEELNARANQLARHMRALGVGPETLVALYLERGVGMIVGLLGVLKAGAAYVPLDSAYPKQRLSFVLEDARIRVVLTEQELAERLPEHAARIVRLGADWPSISAQSTRNVENEASSENLAYVIYTSGSTGRPKGVLITHRSVVNLATALRQAVYRHHHAPLRVSLNAPLAFDASVKQIVQLLDGHTLHVLPDLVRSDPALLRDYIKAWQLDVLDCTPAHLRQLLQEQGGADMAADGELWPKVVLVGGEAIDEPLWNEMSARGAQAFYNVYGPTECTVDATVGRVRPGHRVNIGRAIANTQVYVLGRDLQPVAVGVAGELYIGGEGVARGYLNRPELTQEKFIPHPFSHVPGARLYRTGDLVRWRGDRNLEFIGRADQQVKLRGFRIELGEVEAALRSHSGVQEAVVTVGGGESETKRLLAYVVADPSENVDANVLRQRLRQTLPEYMLPSAIMLLDKLPLTANGKLDRRALPAPEASGRHDQYVAPRTATEEMLAEVWREVLGVERVGAHDNFFDLGGHSLLGMRLASRVRDVFGVELQLRSLFEAPGLEALAERVEELLQAGVRIKLPAVRRAGREGVLPLSFAQQSLWFFHQSTPESDANLMTLGIRLTGPLDVEALTRALNEIVRRHEILRTSFATHEGEPGQVIAPAHDFPLPLFDFSELNEERREEEVLLLFAREERRLFDLSRSPLMRAMLLRTEAESHVLLLTIHHIISDGWSNSILLREMAVLYRALSAGEPSPLDELEIQYADYASWQRRWLRGATLDAHLSYWKRQLDNAPGSLELPTDFPRPIEEGYGKEFPAMIQSFAFDANLSQQIKEFSNREGMSLFMTLLGAFQALLALYSKQDDIVVGTPIAGRNRSEVENLIGMFVNQLTLRTDLSGNPTFRELLRRVRAVTLGAYEHQEFPFNKVVEILNPERGAKFKMPFQMKFRVENALDETAQETLALAGLSLSYFAPRTKPLSIKLDHVVSMREGPEGLTGQWRYNTALFEQRTIERMIEHFEALLRNAVADPERRLPDLLPLPVVA